MHLLCGSTSSFIALKNVRFCVTPLEKRPTEVAKLNIRVTKYSVWPQTHDGSKDHESCYFCCLKSRKARKKEIRELLLDTLQLFRSALIAFPTLRIAAIIFNSVPSSPFEMQPSCFLKAPRAILLLQKRPTLLQHFEPRMLS